MKKRIVMLLYATVLTLGLAVAPVMASVDPFCPVEVETYTYGPFDELRLNKVYRLSVSDDPSAIPTEDFERNGRRYYMLDMIVGDSDSEVVTYTVVFGSVELTRDEQYVVAYGQSGFRPFDVDSFRNGTDSDLLPLFICVSCVVMVASMGLSNVKVKREMRRK